MNNARAGRVRALAAAAFVGCAAGAGCVPAPPPSAAPEPTRTAAALGPGERAFFADLLRIEDARSYDAALLGAAVASPSAEVRARAALTLGRLRRSESAPLARTLLADRDSAVAATAAFALGLIADTAAVSALAGLLATEGSGLSPTIQAEAAYALGRMPGAAAQRALLDFLARANAPEASAEPIGSALLAVWRAARPADPAPILRWAASTDPEIRWRAAYALSRRPDPRATRGMLSLAGDADPRVRGLAVRGLTRSQLDSAAVPHAEALPVLYRIARDLDYAARINAVRSLGSFPVPEVVDSLRALIASPDAHLAVAAMESLGRIGTPAAAAADELEATASTTTAQVFLRQTALEALSLLAPERARATAARLRAEPAWRIRAASATAYARAAGVASPELRALVDDPDSRVAAAALQAAIDAAGDSLARARSYMIDGSGAADPFVRTVALTGLARLRDPATLPLLLDAYQRAQRDTVNDAALAAIDAIAALRSGALDPARAFLARFPRSPDYLVRQKMQAAFGAAAGSAWGEALPLETRRPAEGYRTMVDQWVGAGPSPEAVISTTRGDIRIRLHGDVAPLTTENFLALAARGYFDGQEWPRVVPNFVVQGGDPRGDTNGGPGYAIRDEINRFRYGTGTLGMALSGPDTGGSQFFLTHSPQPHLDGIYTIFGEVVAGQDVLQRILPGDQIRSVRSVN